MTHKTKIASAAFLTAVVSLVLSGCGGVKVERMVPDLSEVSVNPHAYTLTVVRPIGGQESVFMMQDYVENDQYHAVLIETLRNANLFSRVDSNPPADRELYSEIIDVFASGSIDYTFTFEVRYWMINPATGEEVWRKGIRTEHEVRMKEQLSGAKRAVEALEGAVQKNLTQLVTELSNATL